MISEKEAPPPEESTPTGELEAAADEQHGGDPTPPEESTPTVELTAAAEEQHGGAPKAPEESTPTVELAAAADEGDGSDHAPSATETADAADATAPNALDLRDARSNVKAVVTDFPATVGNSPSCDLPLKGPGPDGVYARVRRERNAFIVERAHSEVALLVNEKQLRSVILMDGDILVLGDHEIRVAFTHVDPDSASQGAGRSRRWRRAPDAVVGGCRRWGRAGAVLVRRCCRWARARAELLGQRGRRDRDGAAVGSRPGRPGLAGAVLVDRCRRWGRAGAALLDRGEGRRRPAGAARVSGRGRWRLVGAAFVAMLMALAVVLVGLRLSSSPQPVATAAEHRPSAADKSDAAEPSRPASDGGASPQAGAAAVDGPGTSVSSGAAPPDASDGGTSQSGTSIRLSDVLTAMPNEAHADDAPASEASRGAAETSTPASDDEAGGDKAAAPEAGPDHQESPPDVAAQQSPQPEESSPHGAPEVRSRPSPDEPERDWDAVLASALDRARALYRDGDAAAAAKRLTATPTAMPGPQTERLDEARQALDLARIAMAEADQASRSGRAARLNRSRQKLASAEQALGLSRPSPYLRSLNDEAVPAFREAARRAEDADRTARAYEWYQELLDLKPGDQGAARGIARIEDTARAFYEQGYRLETRDLKSALIYWRKARATVPEGARWHQLAAAKIHEYRHFQANGED